MKIWICGSSPRSGSRNAWTRIKNVNGASRLSNFWNLIFLARSKWFPVAIGDHGRNLVISLWPGDKQQSMDLRHSGSPRHDHKKFRVKNTLEKFWPQFFGIKTASYSLIIFQRAKLSTRSITHIWCSGAIEGHFEGKTPREGHQGGLVCARQCPRSPGTCNPEETGLPGFPMSWSPTLFSGSGPVGLPPVP